MVKAVSKVNYYIMRLLNRMSQFDPVSIWWLLDHSYVFRISVWICALFHYVCFIYTSWVEGLIPTSTLFILHVLPMLQGIILTTSVFSLSPKCVIVPCDGLTPWSPEIASRLPTTLWRIFRTFTTNIAFIIIIMMINMQRWKLWAR